MKHLSKLQRKVEENVTSKLTDKPIEKIDLEKDVIQAIKIIAEAKEAVTKIQDGEAADLIKLIELCFQDFRKQETALKETIVQ